MRPYIEKVSIKGFKTIADLKDFNFRSLNILIGPNGAGKSNLVSFFRMMSWLVAGEFQEYVIKVCGGSGNLLHDGPERTDCVKAALTIKTEVGKNEYRFSAGHASGDTLVFLNEEYRFSRAGFATEANWISLPTAQMESALLKAAEAENKTAQVIRSLMQRVKVFQFHNTSFTSRMRNRFNPEDGRHLKEDAGNLSTFLLRLKRDKPAYYSKIVATTQLILPFFRDYFLESEGNGIILRWSEKGSDVNFNAGQAADGMLRIMALVALLQQPVEDLPDVIILDEPELGLHPSAIKVLGGMLEAVSKHVQVIVATQSPLLIDCFQPEDVVVVERKERATTFHRLSSEELEEWLKDYSLSEIWNKNIIGGRP